MTEKNMDGTDFLVLFFKIKFYLYEYDNITNNIIIFKKKQIKILISRKSSMSIKSMKCKS